MPRGPWIGVIAGAAVLIIIIIWSSWGSGTGRQAAAAIIQAQRDIAAVQEIHSAELDQDALRAAEADLLAANTAFGEAQFKSALDAAQRASRAAQQLLATAQHSEKRSP